jgi:ribosomal protein S18 acetylase RimI-like enzyme
MNAFTIVQAQLEDMPFLLSLAKAEGWNPGLQDGIPFFSTDPNGFFIGKLNGKKIGCISAVAYNQDFGFIGLYIVIPEYRGQGWGLKLWNHAIHYLGKRVIGLDGVIAQQENYKKSGFKFYYRNIRFEGEGGGKSSSSLINLQEVPFETLLAYDTPIFGFSREIFLKNWIHNSNAYGLAKRVKDCILGYGVSRSCVIGVKIGPLFADDPEVAKEIYQGLVAKAGNKPVFLDVSEANQKSIELAEGANLKKVFETARMYTGTPPKQNLTKLFGVTSFELG